MSIDGRIHLHSCFGWHLGIWPSLRKVLDSVRIPSDNPG